MYYLVCKLYLSEIDLKVYTKHKTYTHQSYFKMAKMKKTKKKSNFGEDMK